jgi:membrane protein required for colicin V production
VEVLWILAAAIVFVSTFAGFRHGVVRRVVELVGLIAIFLFASGFAARLRPWLGERFDWDERAVFLTSWVLVLVVGLFGVRLLGIALQKLVRISVVGWLDRLGGAVLGAVFGVLLASCLFVGALALPLGDQIHDPMREDPYASTLLRLAPNVYDALRGLWQGEEFFENLGEIVEPAAREAVERIEAAIEAIDAPKR